jgi:hypothetical protein
MCHALPIIPPGNQLRRIQVRTLRAEVCDRLPTCSDVSKPADCNMLSPYAADFPPAA